MVCISCGSYTYEHIDATQHDGGLRVLLASELILPRVYGHNALSDDRSSTHGKERDCLCQGV